MSTKLRLAIAAGVSAAFCATGAVAQDASGPQSAIGWLSDSIATPTAQSPQINEAPIGQGATTEEITTTPLGAVRRDGVGLLPSNVTGLPSDAFAASDSNRLAHLLQAQTRHQLPVMQEFVLMLLLAELDPPRDGRSDDTLFLARVDTLLELGALEQAQALMERAGPTTPDVFRRWFDVSLLTGHDARACTAMQANPSIAPTWPARIFCLARDGDWQAAALTLETARALGFVSLEDDDLLARFLDPELFEGEAAPDLPDVMTPLRFRLFDAMGEPPATAPLPVAFAVADLRPTMGWKAQIEAAERLARAQAISGELLRAIYTDRRPAASGGVWDRVAAVQRFDVAMLSGDPAAVANTLPEAWSAARSVGLDVVFAALYGAPLTRLPLAPAAAGLALKIGLLSDSYEDVARAALAASPGPRLPRDRFAAHLAQGEAARARPPGALPSAIADGFLMDAAPDRFRGLLSAGKLGEAMLEAASLLSDGAGSDPQDIAEALALFRSVGLHDIARRAALQLLLLER